MLENKVLSLNRNQINDITSLAAALRKNTILTELYLWGNQIKDITCLAAALRENTTLTQLYLGANQIEDITGLAAALHENTSLTFLHLGANRIKDEDKRMLRNIWSTTRAGDNFLRLISLCVDLSGILGGHQTAFSVI